MKNSTAVKNVIQFNTVDDKNVWSCLSTFLSRAGQNSENTRMTYERAIRDFFIVMRNKDLEKLVESDLLFTKPQIETYQVNLKKQYKGTTVNNRMSALKKAYYKLEEYGFDVKSSWFDVERYDEHEKESYDSMTLAEVKEAVELVRGTRKGTEKSLFLEMAFATAFRKESLKNVTFADIYKHGDDWIVETIGKGNKKDSKKISDDLYDRVKEFKEESGRKDNEKIFVLTNKTIRGMMDYIRENIDFGRRNIVFHSLKKASINEVALKTGYDLKAMQAQGNHSNIATTLNFYMAEKNLDDMTVVDMNYNPPVEKFEDMSKEELLKMLRSAPRDVQVKLLKQEGVI